jgi:hypothetical protein
MQETIELIRFLSQQVQENQSEFSDEELSGMFSVLQRAVNFVESKQAKPPIAAPPPDVPESSLESAVANGVLYDPKSKRMLVQYHGKYPQKKGSIYSYEGITPMIAQMIRGGHIAPKTSGANDFHRWHRNVRPSLGASIDRLLKKTGVPYKKIA